MLRRFALRNPRATVIVHRDGRWSLPERVVVSPFYGKGSRFPAHQRVSDIAGRGSPLPGPEPGGHGPRAALKFPMGWCIIMWPGRFRARRTPRPVEAFRAE